MDDAAVELDDNVVVAVASWCDGLSLGARCRDWELLGLAACERLGGLEPVGQQRANGLGGTIIDRHHLDVGDGNGHGDGSDEPDGWRELDGVRAHQSLGERNQLGDDD